MLRPVNAGTGDYAVDVEGVTYLHGVDGSNDYALLIMGDSIATGVLVYSEQGDTGVVINDIFKTTKITSMNYAGIDSTATANPTHFYGPTASGSGDDTCVVWALDTTGTPTAITDVKITVKTLAGADYASGRTTSSGSWKFFATGVDTFLVTGRRPGYVWSHMGGQNSALMDTVIVGATGGPDTLVGYNIAIGSPAGSDLCRVYGHLYDLEGNALENVVVRAELTRRNVRDTCNNTLLGFYRAETDTDSNGYFYLDLLKNKCTNITTKYRFSFTYPSGETEDINKRFTAPDADSVAFTW